MKNNFLLVVLLCLIFLGCSFELDYRANGLIDVFYFNIQSNQADSNLQYFSDDYYNITTPNQTLRLFELLKEKVGVPTTYELSYQKSTKIVGYNIKSGEKLELIYNVNWTNGTTKDSFLLFKVKGTDYYDIDGYHSEIKINLG